MSIVVSLFAGWILLIGLTFAIQHYSAEVTSATGEPPVQIFIDALGATTAKLLLLVVIGAQLFCGMSSVTANSRMIYAFSRDGALPGSSIWHRVNKRTRTPTNAIWLAAAGALILGLPYLWNSTAYAAVTSIATIGLYVAYVSPTFLRLRQGDNFQRGPWHLGRWSYVVGWIAVVWVVFIFDPVHAADAQPDHGQQLQLHGRRGGGGHRLRRHLLAGVGAQVVHRAAGAGHAGGARRHRAASSRHDRSSAAGLPRA